MPSEGQMSECMHSREAASAYSRHPLMQVLTLQMAQIQREVLIPYCTFTPLSYDIGDLRDLFLAVNGALNSPSS